MQEPRTLNDIYEVTININRPAIMKYKSGDRWLDVTVPEFRDSVRWLATALYEMGVKPGDRVAILSENRPEWTI
ncbi:MAG TPA: AMP-binding protein, partial [Thermoanaerobaculia bacterium]